MRIGLNPPNPQEVTAEATPSAAVRQTSKTSSDEGDSFSSDTVSLSALANQALQMPEVRQNKVDALQQSIASGQYIVDPKGIAAAMLGY